MVQVSIADGYRTVSVGIRRGDGQPDSLTLDYPEVIE